MFTITTDETSRKSAIECKAALGTIEHLANNLSSTYDSYDLSEKEAIELMIERAGNISPQAMGVIATLTEHVFWSLTSGYPDLDKWTPKAAMTEVQQIEHANRVREESLTNI